MYRSLRTLVIAGWVLAGVQQVWSQGAPEDMALVQQGETQFYLDAREVTVEEMKAFDPDYQPAYEYFKDAKMPATAIPFDVALAYCVAKGKRLPTSGEWQRACRGAEGKVYSYGNNYDPSKSRVGRRVWTDGPKAVGSYEKNVYGLYDMTGNIWEWADSGEAEGEKRAVHGGSWTDGPGATTCMSKRTADPSLRSVNYGFRCARSLTGEDRARMAAIEAEKTRKADAVARREAARIRAEREAVEAAKRAKVEAEAQKVLEAEEAEKRARKAEAAQKAEAFARKVEGMVSVKSSIFQMLYVDPHEVTVEAFQKFEPSYRPDEFSADARMPATRVTYAQAAAYCASLGKRLPTAEEWVATCLGEKGYLYGYAQTYDASMARTGKSWTAGAVPVGTGAPNLYGITGMTGNAWEWVDGWYGQGQKLRILHGGSWVDGSDRAKCTGSTWSHPEASHANAGFRCVVSEE